MNTLICAVTSRHFTAISSFFSSIMLSLAGKNLVIGMTTSEGRFRLALNSSSLIGEIRRVQCLFPGILEERDLSQDYV